MINEIIYSFSDDKRSFNITLKIKDKGYHRIFYSGEERRGECPNFSPKYPDEIDINGISQNNISPIYYFNETNNVIKLKYYEENFNNFVTPCCFFFTCHNITEISFSEFDSSKFKNLKGMFS